MTNNRHHKRVDIFLMVRNINQQLYLIFCIYKRSHFSEPISTPKNRINLRNFQNTKEKSSRLLFDNMSLKEDTLPNPHN